VQNALSALVVVDARAGAQLLQGIAAVGAQTHDLLDVVARARRGTLAQKLQTPQPLTLIGTQAKQQRGIFLAQPLQHFQGGTGVGPGLGMADRDLATVGETGFCGRGGLSVDDADLMTELRQVIGGADPQQAAAQNDDVHDASFNKSALHGGMQGLIKIKQSNTHPVQIAAPPVLVT